MSLTFTKCSYRCVFFDKDQNFMNTSNFFFGGGTNTCVGAPTTVHLTLCDILCFETTRTPSNGLILNNLAFRTL